MFAILLILAGVVALLAFQAKAMPRDRRFVGLSGSPESMVDEELRQQVAEILNGIQELLQQAAGDSLAVLVRITAADFGDPLGVIWMRHAAQARLPARPFRAQLFEDVDDDANDLQASIATARIRAVILSTDLPIAVRPWAQFEARRCGVLELIDLDTPPSLDDLASAADLFYGWLWNQSHYPSTSDADDWGAYMRLGLSFAYTLLQPAYKVRLGW